MTRSQHYRFQFVLIVAILGLTIVGSPNTYAGSTGSASATHVDSKLLIDVVAIPQSPGSIVVSGQNFTPGGTVYIAMYDQWGMQLYPTRWVFASTPVFGPNGSQDPAQGYVRGGSIREVFTDTPAIYGPNGSQDPANGYVAASSAGNLCGATAMIRAFDRQTSVWSNLLDIDAGC